jgi:hypothetical protein
MFGVKVRVLIWWSMLETISFISNCYKGCNWLTSINALAYYSNLTKLDKKIQGILKGEVSLYH